MNNLNEQQKKALKIFDSIKSVYRRENFERENLDFDTLTQELLSLGMLKQSKNGALSVSKRADYMINNRLDRKDTTIKLICDLIGYNGLKISYSLADAPKNLDSYWDGGSRDYFYFFNLDTQKIVKMESNHPYFEANRPRTLDVLPQRVLLIKHIWFCGKDLGLEIYSNPSDRIQWLSQSEKK